MLLYRRNPAGQRGQVTGHGRELRVTGVPAGAAQGRRERARLQAEKLGGWASLSGKVTWGEKKRVGGELSGCSSAHQAESGTWALSRNSPANMRDVKTRQERAQREDEKGQGTALMFTPRPERFLALPCLLPTSSFRRGHQ